PAVAAGARLCDSDVQRPTLASQGATPMLTPAEELGLSGLNLASRVRKAFYKLPEDDILDLMRRIGEEALRRHVVYMRDGRREPIGIMACPVTALPDQLAYIHFVTQTIPN